MTENLRKSLGLLYARWQFRKESDRQQSLTEFLSRARTILIVLPWGYEDALAAGNTLRRTLDRFKNLHLTIVTTGVRPSPLAFVQRSDVVRFEAEDVNKIFIPRQAILQSIVSRSYDVAIDLNLDFVLHAAYICRVSRAPVRVGIFRQHGERFFNVQVRLDRSASPKVVYERFAHCLGMF